MSKSNAGTTKPTRAQQLLIQRAAEAADSSGADFILNSALARAEYVLADRKLFVASEEQWAEFQTLLDLPMSPLPKLRQLLRREHPFAHDE